MLMIFFVLISLEKKFFGVHFLNSDRIDIKIGLDWWSRFFFINSIKLTTWAFICAIGEMSTWSNDLRHDNLY